ncbi:LOW QUALITY PROTEIN: hypothetical protein V2J09_017809 [Rumex salicifolius]
MERSASIQIEERADLNLLAESDEAVVRVDLTDDSSASAVEDGGFDDVPFGIKLMYGRMRATCRILASGIDVNYRDADNRTPLHVAACQGYKEVVELLIENGAEVEAKDRWGSTPLADAIYYKNNVVIKFLEKHGALPLMPPMHVKTLYRVPEYEIHPQEIDFTNSINITKGTFRKASWRGIDVAVKQIGDDLFTDEDKVRAFRDELALLQRVRHPNVVQFLGALPNIYPRGISYLHENKPEPVIHLDLEPSNILCDDSGNLKVADFGVSKLLKVAKEIVDGPQINDDTSCRYMAPELFRNEVYNTKVDVFSFGLILQEMIEGCPPFSDKDETEVPQLYAKKHRPPFRALGELYDHGLKELIEECWSEDPTKIPTFREIIDRLDHMYSRIGSNKRWKFPCLV